MKIIKKTLIVVGLLILGFFGYRYLSNIELTKVTLKCKTTESIVSNHDKNEVTYYKITKHLFTDEPNKLIVSNPDTNRKNLPPFISGYIDSSPEVIYVQFTKKYFEPKYYTFVFNEPEDVLIHLRTYISSVTYLNREDLSMETDFIGDETVFSKKQCEISSNKEFNQDYESKLEKIKKNLKI